MLFELLLYLTAGISSIIVLIHIVLGLGALANRLRDLRSRGSARSLQRFPVSVLVVAKDEVDSLPQLLSSLESQSTADFEVVLVNDRSQDGTGRIMEAFREKHGRRIKVIHNEQEPGFMNPKQYALDIAARSATGEVLLFTDADCIVPPGWVDGLLAYFHEPRIGIVFGQIALPNSGSFLGQFQAFDQPLIHQWNSGTAALGMPGSCFGNNLAARRSVIEEVGGFRGLGETLTEDAALVTAASSMRWQVRVSTRLETMIATRPQAAWRDFLNQHLRWNTGAFYHRDFGTRLSYRFIVLFLTVSVLALPLCPFLPFLLVLPAASFISVGLMGFLAGVLYRANKARYLLKLVPYTLFFMLFYSYVTVLSMLKITPEWKGRKLQKI